MKHHTNEFTRNETMNLTRKWAVPTLRIRLTIVSIFLVAQLGIVFKLTMTNDPLSLAQNLSLQAPPAPELESESHIKSPQDFKESLRQLASLPINSTKRVAFITFSYVRYNDTKHLFEFLLPAVDTWAAPTEDEKRTVSENKAYDQTTLYVVFTNESKGPFEKACLQGHGIDERQKNLLCPRIRPIYVDCPEGKFGESPCCKQQKGLLTIFENKTFPLYDWYAFFDDDYYFLKEYLVENLQLHRTPEFPMAQVARNSLAVPLGWTNGRRPCQKRGPEFKYPW